MSEGNKSFINKQTLPTAIALIVIGVLFCIFKSDMLSILFTVVGVVLICVGIIELLNKLYVESAVEIAVGIVVITCGWTILDITLLVIGIVAIIYGIYLFATLIPKYKNMKGYDLVANILAPLFVIIVGILLVVSKWQLSNAIFIVLGILSIVDGIFMLAKK